MAPHIWIRAHCKVQPCLPSDCHPHPLFSHKMSFTLGVTGTLFPLKWLLWGAYLCSSSLTWGGSVCWAQPCLIDRAIYPNTGREVLENTHIHIETHWDICFHNKVLLCVSHTVERLITKSPPAMYGGGFVLCCYSPVCLLVAGHSGDHTFILRAAVDNRSTHVPQKSIVFVCVHIFSSCLYLMLLLFGHIFSLVPLLWDLAGPHIFTVLFEGWVGWRLGLGVEVRSRLERHAYVRVCEQCLRCVTVRWSEARSHWVVMTLLEILAHHTYIHKQTWTCTNHEYTHTDKHCVYKYTQRQTGRVTITGQRV